MLLFDGDCVFYVFFVVVVDGVVNGVVIFVDWDEIEIELVVFFEDFYCVEIGSFDFCLFVYYGFVLGDIVEKFGSCEVVIFVVWIF